MSERRARGEGTWRRRPEGGWELRIVIGGQRRSFYGRTKAEATAKRQKAEETHALGLRPDRQTVGEYLRAWVQGRAGLRPATRRRYEQIVEHLVAGLGRYRLADLRPEHVDRYLRQRRAAGAAPLTVNHHRTVLATALATAEKRRLVAQNAARLSEPEHVPHAEPRFLDREQVGALLAAVAGTDLEALITTAVHTGLRQGELLGLRWEDVDLDDARLRVRRALQAGHFVETKTGRSRRSVDLPAAVVTTLRAHRASQSERRLQTPQSLVFSRQDGRSPLNGTTVTHALQAALRRAGLPRMRFHDLRHTHASLLIAAGVHPRLIMERLGHSTIATTMDIYGHVFPSAGREAAARLDQMFDLAASH